MKLPDFNNACHKCKLPKPPEDYHFSAGSTFKRIRRSVQCNHCQKKVYYSEMSKAKAVYLCALWRMIQVPMLWESELKQEARMRKEKAKDDLGQNFKSYFPDNPYPTEAEVETLIYRLMTEDINKDVEKELAKIKSLITN